MENELSNSIIKIKYDSIYKMSAFVILLIITIMFFNIYSSENVASGSESQNKLSGNVVLSQEYNGNAQISKLSVIGGLYKLEPNTFKEGVPIRIVADISQMPGCSKNIVIPSLNIRKFLDEKDNVIEFTPQKAGTFNIVCGMNMYKGTFTVLQFDGTKSDFVEKVPTGGHTCGVGGGCGCGG